MSAVSKNKVVTVADLVEFFKTIPPETKVAVLRDDDYGVKWSEDVNDGEDFGSVDGIDYIPTRNTVYLGN